MGVYSNEAAAYAASVKEATVNPIQFAIDSYRSDLQLFEAMIERDVSYALNESGVIVLEEEQVKAVDSAAKKGIFAKIKEAIEKVIAWIKNAFKDFKDKVLEVTKADKKIFFKYGSFLENRYDEMKKCPAKGTTVNFDYLDYLQTNVNSINDLIEDMSKYGADNMEDAKTAYDKCMAMLKVDLKDIPSRLKNTEDKPIMEKLTGNQYKDMVYDIKTGYKEGVDTVKKSFDAQLKNANIRKGNIKVQMNNSDDKEEIKALHNQYTIVNMEIAMIKRICDIAVLDVRTRIAIERANFLVLGAWAYKQLSVEDVEESALIDEAFILEETSNAFIEETFAWI